MKYAIIIKKQISAQFAYTSSTIMRFFFSLLAFFIQLSLWASLLASRSDEKTSLEDMIIYIVINTIVSLATSANIATNLEPSIRDGSVAHYFIRPVSFKLYCFSEIIGENLYFIGTSGLPLIVFSFLFYRLPLPSLAHGLLFIVSLFIGCWIQLELTYIFGLLAFFTQKAWYINWYLRAFLMLFGGTAIPLWFYPSALLKISYFLPFRYISFEPINFFLNRTPVDQGVVFVLISTGWLLVLNGIGHLIYKHVEKRLTINGG